MMTPFCMTWSWMTCTCVPIDQSDSEVMDLCVRIGVLDRKSSMRSDSRADDI